MNLTSQIIGDKYEVLSKYLITKTDSIWLSRRLKSNEEFIIKLVDKSYISEREEDIAKFRYENDILIKNAFDEIVKTYEIGVIEGKKYLVMDYAKGNSLEMLMKRRKSFSLEETVKIVLKVCYALNRVHESNIYHKQLSPSKIMLDVDAHDVNVDFKLKILGFGHSHIKVFENKNELDENDSLYYCSPEYLGAIQRAVDEKSDLYSIGIIFYKLLTGRLPFSAKNVNSLIHDQIAVIPEKPSNLIKEIIPKVIDKVIQKLLEKEPNDRYQTCNSLIKDLELFLSGEYDFEPGMFDGFKGSVLKTEMIGRREEFSKLLNLFNSAMTGNGNICFIKGEAGMGKTRLVEELRNKITEENACFISGKCFSGDSKVPYGPLKDAINQYMEKLNTYSTEQKELIIDSIKKEFWSLGKIVRSFCSAYNEIFKDSPELVELDKEQENSRYQSVIVKLVITIAKHERVLVVLLDDLHWTDIATVDFLEKINDEISTANILLVGTYRGSEVVSGHPLNVLIEKIRTKRGLINEIELLPLNFKDMNEYLAKLILAKKENILGTTELILEKSQGNPLFASEILKFLIEKGVVFRDKNEWKDNHELMHEIEIPQTVVEILLGKISKLREQESEVLSIAAAIGKKFEIEFLAELLNIEKNELKSIIEKSVRYQFLEYNFLDDKKIRFVHDRIRDAFYVNLEEEKRKSIHLKIAKTIEKKNVYLSDENLFELSYHYLESGNEEKALEFLIPAGHKAKDNYAHEEALKCFLKAKCFYEKNKLDDSNEYIKCIKEIADIFSMTGEIDNAIELYNIIITKTENYYQKSKIYQDISQAYFRKGDNESCINYASIGLMYLGEKIPKGNLKTSLLLIVEYFKHLIFSYTPISLLWANKTKNYPESVEAKLIVWYFYSLNWYAGLNDVPKFLYFTLKGLNISQKKIGRSKELSMMIMSLGIVYLCLAYYKMAHKYLYMSLDMRKDIEDLWGIGQSYQFLASYYNWNAQFDKASDCCFKALDIFSKIGDLKEINLTYNMLVQSYYYYSDYIEMKQSNDIYYNNAKKLKDSYTLAASHIYYTQYNREIGNFKQSEKHGLKCIEITNSSKDYFNLCSINIELGITYLEMGELKKAKQCLEYAKNLHENNNFMSHYTSFVYTYIAFCLLEEIFTEGLHINIGAINPKSLKIIRQISNKAVKKTKCWPNHYGTTLRMKAMYFWVAGDNVKARKYFLKSIDYCNKKKRRYEEGVSCFKFALFLKETSFEDKANEYFELAYKIFDKIGAVAYIEKSKELLKNQDFNIGSVARFTAEIKYAQRLTSIISLSQKISQILTVSEIIETVLNIVVETTGAQNGYIIIRENESYKIVGSKTVNNIVIYEIPLVRTLLDKVFETKKPILIEDVSNEDFQLEETDKMLSYQMKSVLCMPIQYNNILKAVCYLDNPLVSGVFNEEDVNVLNVIFTQVAISLENANLYENLEKLVNDRTEQLNKSNEELRETLEKLKNTQEQLLESRKISALTRIVSRVAHEINTPIGVCVTGVSHLDNALSEIVAAFENNSISKSFLRNYISTSREITQLLNLNLNRISELVSRFKRIAVNKKSETKKKITIIDCINEAIITQRSRFEDKNYVIEVNCEPDIQIESYPNAIQEIMSNLIENSIIHGSYYDSKLNIVISVHRESDNMYISYSDNGKGIPKEEVSTIFDPFGKNDNSSEGIGLGLNIIYNLVTQKLGGTVRCESDLGKGVLFEIVFPV